MDADVQGERILSQGRKEDGMTYTEWIVSVDDECKDFDEMFVGNVRDGDRLVRCCDCAYFNRIEDTGFGRCRIHHDGTHGRRMTQTVDYCSWAERKDTYETD